MELIIDTVYREKNNVYVGFGTICGFRVCSGCENISPTDKGGTTDMGVVS